MTPCKRNLNCWIKTISFALYIGQRNKRLNLLVSDGTRNEKIAAPMPRDKKWSQHLKEGFQHAQD